MNLKNKKATLVFTILSFLIVFILLFGVRPSSRILLTILPPSDLYNPIVKQAISLKKEIEYPSFQLSNRYVGTYIIGIYLQKPSPFGTPITSSSIVNFKIHEGSNVLFKRNFNRWADRFGGPGENRSGIILGYYKVPEDIPVALKVQATVSIISADTEFEKQYGTLEFFIKRKTDL